MKRRHQGAIGREHEQLAAEFLTGLGFVVLERNWRAGHKEIDLIVRRDELIVFVEVKADLTGKFGHPAGWVDAAKIRHLTDAARRWLIEKEIDGCDVRFDLVTFSEGRLEHFPNAFAAAE